MLSIASTRSSQLSDPTYRSEMSVDTAAIAVDVRFFALLDRRRDGYARETRMMDRRRAENERMNIERVERKAREEKEKEEKAEKAKARKEEKEKAGVEEDEREKKPSAIARL